MAADVRTASEVGRKARLELVFGRRQGKTVLTHGYAEPPLRTGRCLDTDRGAHLILASSAPGIFGGDAFEQHVQIGAGAVVRLTSQSSLQVHPSAAPRPAQLTSRFVVAEGGELSCGWDPTIPFADARLDQRIAIEVADGGRLSWSDGLTSGRQGHGESWRFTSVDHELRLTLAGRLAYLERYRIMPGPSTTSPRWTTGGAGYVGTMLEVGPDVDAPLAERIHRALADVDGVVASADLLESRLLLVRIAADSGVPFQRARAIVGRELAREP